MRGVQGAGQIRSVGDTFAKGPYMGVQQAIFQETVFVISVYNKRVRALVKQNQSHDFFDDHWADAHTQNVVASSEAKALEIASRRYPPEDGFVIQTIYRAKH